MIDKDKIDKTLKYLNKVGPTRHIISNSEYMSFDLKELIVDCYNLIGEIQVEINLQDVRIDELLKEQIKQQKEIDNLKKGLLIENKTK